jgi:phosphate transport system substrate-binding protein
MPNGSIGAANSQALVTAVKNTNYSIGYADLSDAEGKNVAYAKLKNAAGEYILPSSASASTFLGEFSSARYFNRTTGAVTLDFNKSISGAYNMSLLTYAIVKSADGTAKQTAARDFVEWLLTDCGPQYAQGMGYSPISGSLKTKAIALVH